MRKFKKNDDDEIEKVLRIIIVLLFQNHPDFNTIIYEILIFLPIKGKFYEENIKKFYQFTTGTNLTIK